jgi:adenylate cyclase
MNAERVERRLAAVLAADVAGYSRLVGADEEGTLAALRALRRELIDPGIAAHRGRIVKTTGDGMLVEFASVIDALRCATEMQQRMAERAAGVPPARRIEFRIGIHQGDVVVEDGDIFGDGVNIAARLEGLAEPGGICISARVQEDARGRLDLAFEDLGEQPLKNIARLVRVYRVRIASATAPAAVQAPALPEKPSIAVLPFDNMSGDPEQDYFADGLTEDIITDLSRFRDLLVIARNTSFSYRGRITSVPEIARELGVHFVLEGSVRKSGRRIRITAQLIDGINGRHIWAQRYDGQLADVFELQEEVIRQVLGNIGPYIDKSEMERSMRGERRFDQSQDLAWQSYAKFQHGMSAGDSKSVEEAIELARRSLALNSKCGLAYLSICWSYAMQSLYAWGEDPVGAADRALECAEAAMLALPQSETAYNCLGVARFRTGQYEQAVRDFRSAHEINPNDVRTLFALAWGEATLGDTTAARRHASEALRLSPKDLWSQLAYLTLAMAAFVERDHEGFVEWADKAIQVLPVAPIRRAMMIAYAAQVGDQALLQTHLDAVSKFAPDFIASLFRGENRLFAREEHMEMVLDGLRKAGLGP